MNFLRNLFCTPRAPSQFHSLHPDDILGQTAVRRKMFRSQSHIPDTHHSDASSDDDDDDPFPYDTVLKDFPLPPPNDDFVPPNPYFLRWQQERVAHTRSTKNTPTHALAPTPYVVPVDTHTLWKSGRHPLRRALSTSCFSRPTATAYADMQASPLLGRSNTYPLSSPVSSSPRESLLLFSPKPASPARRPNGPRLPPRGGAAVPAHVIISRQGVLSIPAPPSHPPPQPPSLSFYNPTVVRVVYRSRAERI